MEADIYEGLNAKILALQYQLEQERAARRQTERALELACELVHGNGCPMIRDLYRRKDNPYKKTECNTCDKYGDNPPISKCYVDYFLQQAKEGEGE